MKYKVHDYAKALDEALNNPKADHQAAAKNFLTLVRRNGDEAQLKKILDEAARLAKRKGGFREVMVESARPLSKAQGEVVAKFIKPGDVVSYAIDPELVAGIRLTVNDEQQFDGTMKKKLENVFEKSF